MKIIVIFPSSISGRFFRVLKTKYEDKETSPAFWHYNCPNADESMFQRFYDQLPDTDGTLIIGGGAPAMLYEEVLPETEVYIIEIKPDGDMPEMYRAFDDLITRLGL